jgi:hypothetical protein
VPDQTPGPDRMPAPRDRARHSEVVPYRRAALPERRPDVPAELLDDGRRRWQEHLAPGAVILIGVLAVVSFGLVIKSRSGADPDPSLAVPNPGPTAEQVPIPLPSASASPTRRPVNSITFERGSVPDVVNLPTEGTSDWVHWGEQGKFAMERKAEGEFAILEGTPTAARTRSDAGPESYRWTGGSPMSSARGVTSGVRLCGEGDGFTLSAPAGTVGSRLRLFVGVSSGQGLLQLQLSTGGEVVSDRVTVRGSEITTASYTVNYRATGTGKISIKWITEESFGGNCGGVVLYAAALS